MKNILKWYTGTKGRAENWQISIGLQVVDHVSVFYHLIELAKKHIEGIITIEEVQEKNSSVS